MNIAFVGCGYVFDIYMRSRWAHTELTIMGVFDVNTARSAIISKHYGLRVYDSYDDLLSDLEVETVINLTNIGSHYATTKLALEAGKNVYSEKPFTLDIALSKELFDLAATRGVVLTGAPCNVFSDAVSTAWKAVRDGAIGKPVLVYAELDDNPAHLMHLETVRSPTGAPFPYVEELQEGCTVEHVAYHLVWLCAMFGPVQAVSAASSCLVPEKTDYHLDPPDTPDLSVAYLTFADGLVARVTCSWVAPRDHSFRIIGDEGQLKVDNVFHDQSAVHLERYSRVSLSVRKSYSARANPIIGRAFGVGGRRLRLVRQWKSYAVEAERGVGTSPKHKLISWVRRREIYAQDKFLGIAEMDRALRERRPQALSPEFLLHLNELTLLIQGASGAGIATEPATTFAPVRWVPQTTQDPGDYRSSYRSRVFENAAAGLIESLHRR